MSCVYFSVSASIEVLPYTHEQKDTLFDCGYHTVRAMRNEPRDDHGTYDDYDQLCACTRSICPCVCIVSSLLNFFSRVSRVHGRRPSRFFHNCGASCLSGRCCESPLMDCQGSASYVGISVDILLVDQPSPFLAKVNVLLLVILLHSQW